MPLGILAWTCVGGLVLIAVIVGGLHLYTNVLVREAEATYPPVGQFMEVDGLRLHYVRKGRGAAVVLLHGNAGSIHDFTMTIFDEVAKGFDAIAMDRSGHGYSDRLPNTRSSAIDQARILHDAFVKLGVQSPVLVAYSWSGALALAYATAYPDDLIGLVLLAPVAYPDPAFDAPLYKIARVPVLRDLVPGALVTPFAEAIARPSLEKAFAPDAVPSAYAKVATALWLRPGQVKAMAEDVATLNTALRAISRRYREIRVPTVILAGDQDTSDPPQRQAFPLHEAIPGSRLVIFKGVGHMLPHSCGQAVLDAIDWVSSRSSE